MSCRYQLLLAKVGIIFDTRKKNRTFTQSSSYLVRDDCSIGFRWHFRKKRKHLNISRIAFGATVQKNSLRLDGFSMEFKVIYDSPPLPTRFYLVHPQHFPQTYLASEDPQKSSRIYLCSLRRKKSTHQG